MYAPSDNFGPWAALVTVNGKTYDAKAYPQQWYPPHGSVSPKAATRGSVVDIRVIHVFADSKNKYFPDVAYGKVTCISY